MKALITGAFRIKEGDATRKYTPGDVAEGDSAVFAVKNGYGKEQDTDAADKPAAEKQKAAPANKAAKPDSNKGA